LNEKPGGASLLTGGAGPSASSYSANKYSTVGASKPPTGTAGVGSSFKPSFASIEQLGSSNAGNISSTSSTYERSPYRNLTANTQLNTPSSMSSISSTSTSQAFSTTNPINLKNLAPPSTVKTASYTSQAFTYNPAETKINTENVSSNLPQPKFVSKYT